LLWGGAVILLVALVIVAAVLVSDNTTPAIVEKDLAPAVNASDHTLGSATSTVTLVEYADFQCPACQAYFPLLQKLTTDYQSKILFVYRYFPLPQHPNAVPAAEAAEAASLQGKFWPMHDLLFGHYQDWENLSDPTPIFIQYATQLGLNVTKFQSDMQSDAVKNVVNADLASATSENLQGTPSFYLNGKYIQNPPNYDAFKTLIDNALQSK